MKLYLPSKQKHTPSVIGSTGVHRTRMQLSDPISHERCILPTVTTCIAFNLNKTGVYMYIIYHSSWKFPNQIAIYEVYCVYWQIYRYCPTPGSRTSWVCLLCSWAMTYRGILEKAQWCLSPVGRSSHMRFVNQHLRLILNVSSVSGSRSKSERQILGQRLSRALVATRNLLVVCQRCFTFLALAITNKN